MPNPITGSTPVDGSCVYCNATLVQTYADHRNIDGVVIRITDANPICVNGHPQPGKQPDDEG